MATGGCRGLHVTVGGVAEPWGAAKQLFEMFQKWDLTWITSLKPRHAQPLYTLWATFSRDSHPQEVITN